MSEAIGTLLQLLLSALGVLAMPDMGVLGLAVAVVALAVLALATTRHTPLSGICSSVHPRRGIDVSTPLAQSDPDAAGHPLPRAPGVARTA